MTRVGPNVTNVSNLLLDNAEFNADEGDDFHIAIRHSVRCFRSIFGGGRVFSEWGLQGGDERFIHVVVQQ